VTLNPICFMQRPWIPYVRPADLRNDDVWRHPATRWMRNRLLVIPDLIRDPVALNRFRDPVTLNRFALFNAAGFPYVRPADLRNDDVWRHPEARWLRNRLLVIPDLIRDPVALNRFALFNATGFRMCVQQTYGMTMCAVIPRLDG
jgi:hypothetical protein